MAKTAIEKSLSNNISIKGDRIGATPMGIHLNDAEVSS
jgi:hypothetical protein